MLATAYWFLASVSVTIAALGNNVDAHVGDVKNLQPRHEVTVTVTETFCPAGTPYPTPMTSATLPPATPGYGSTPGYGTTPVQTPGIPATSTPVVSENPPTPGVSSETSGPAPPTPVIPVTSVTASTSSVMTTEVYSTSESVPATSSKTATTPSITPTRSTANPPPTSGPATSSSTLPAAGGAGHASVNLGLWGLVAMAALV